MNLKTVISFSLILFLLDISLGWTQSDPAEMDAPRVPEEAYKQYYGEAYGTYTTDPEHAKELATKALKQAKLLEHDTWTANAHFLLGLIHTDLVEFADAYRQYHAAEQLYQSVENEEYALRSNWNMGVVMIQSQNLQRGELLFINAEAEIDRLLGLEDQVSFYQDFAELYFQANAFQSSIQQYQKALELVSENDDVRGEIIYALATCYIELGNLSVGDSLIQKSIGFLAQGNNTYLLGFAYADLGYEQYVKGNYDSAKVLLHKALKLTETVTDPSGIRPFWFHVLSKSYKAQGESDRALEYLLQAAEIISGLPAEQKYKVVYSTLIAFALDLDKPEIGKKYNSVLAEYDAELIAKNEALEALLLESDFQEVDAMLAIEEESARRNRQERYWQWAFFAIALMAGILLLWAKYRHRRDQQTIRSQKQQLEQKVERDRLFAANWAKATKQLHR